MHKSVLLKECLHYLNCQEDSVIVDCTLGYAGHSSEILKRISSGFLYAFDQDEEAILSSKDCLEEISSNYEIIPMNFENLKNEMEKRTKKIDGILFDLGVSSPQLDEDYRGFSFHKAAPLDMRMNTNQTLTAHQIVNTYSYEELVHIFREYGEEKYASSIASHIVKSRETKSINTTLELVEVIQTSVPAKYKREKHPARKVFQAIRIAVNRELDVFEDALHQALDIISVGGRVCVITFHSLEDRICKNIFRDITKLDDTLKNLPIIPKEYQPKFKIIAVKEAGKEELIENNRARSAKLRVIERIGE